MKNANTFFRAFFKSMFATFSSAWSLPSEVGAHRIK